MENRWFAAALAHWGNDTAHLRPTPMPWHSYVSYLLLAKYTTRESTIARSQKLRQSFTEALQDTLTALQELILAGDVDNARYWLERRRGRASGSSLSAVITAATTKDELLIEQQTKTLSQNPTEGSTATHNNSAVVAGAKPGEPKIEQETRVVEKFSMLDVKQTGSGLLQFAVLTGDRAMVDFVLDEWRSELLATDAEQRPRGPWLDDAILERINAGDYVTAATGLHFAVFCEDSEMFGYLAQLGADPTALDNYFGSPLDYARMLGLAGPASRADAFPRLQYDGLKLWNAEKRVAESISIEQFEEMFDVTFTPLPVCDDTYIEELLFSGLKIEPSMDFRAKYFPEIYKSSGDENIILAYINETAGYGAFASRAFGKGDFIVRYGGCFKQDKKIRDRAYCMSSGVENVGCDAKFDRNLGGMLNHAPSAPTEIAAGSSGYANVQAECCFDRGCEQAIIVALRDILPGEQLLLDYSGSYWTASALKVHGALEDMAVVEHLPLQEDRQVAPQVQHHV